jgi:hypothetical protein
MPFFVTRFVPRIAQTANVSRLAYHQRHDNPVSPFPICRLELHEVAGAKLNDVAKMPQRSGDFLFRLRNSRWLRAYRVGTAYLQRQFHRVTDLRYFQQWNPILFSHVLVLSPSWR